MLQRGQRYATKKEMQSREISFQAGDHEDVVHVDQKLRHGGRLEAAEGLSKKQFTYYVSKDLTLSVDLSLTDYVESK
jgi:hypothetical protein